MQRPIRLPLALAFALAGAQPAPAAEPAPVAQPAPAAEPVRTERLFCRRDAVVGSLIPSRRVCRTKAEWDRIADSARYSADRYTQENMGRVSCPNQLLLCPQ